MTKRSKATTVTVDISDLPPEEAAAKLREAFGAPILFPTDLQPHRVCAKKAKKDKPTAMHGVTFRRSGSDVVACAMNGRAAIRVVLHGDAELVPETGAVIPAKAAKMIAGATDELAAMWFANGRVRIAADGEIHEFRLLDALAFDAEATFAASNRAPRSLRGVVADAGQLAKLQRAMACEYVELRDGGKGSVFVLPGDNPAGAERIGMLVLEDRSGDE